MTPTKPRRLAGLHAGAAHVHERACAAGHISERGRLARHFDQGRQAQLTAPAIDIRPDKPPPSPLNAATFTSAFAPLAPVMEYSASKNCAAGTSCPVRRHLPVRLACRAKSGAADVLAFMSPMAG